MTQRPYDSSKSPDEMDALWKADIEAAGAQTEEQMRDAKAPTPETPEALAQYIATLTDRPHDYGTCVYAMSLAAVAAFNYVAHRLNVSGFQAGCADMDILRRTRHMENGFMILDGKNVLYPQYDLVERAKEFVGEKAKDLKDVARKLLLDQDEIVSPSVRARWEAIASGKYAG